MPMATKIITQHRRGTVEQWIESGIIPYAGEIVIEECPDGTFKTKIGDGVNVFVNLPYQNLDEELSELKTYVDGKVVDGLFYENNKLYLTLNGEIVSDPVEIVGGGGGSSSSVLNIGYITTSPVVVTPNDTALLRFTFSGTDSSGDAILQASATWKINGSVVKYGVVNDGENEFDVTKHLKIGTNEVLLTVVDGSGAMKTKTWSVRQVDIYIESNFNDKMWQPIGPVIFNYIPYGAVDKTVHFILDGNHIGSMNLPARVSGNTVQYTLPTQKHGAHLLEVYIEAKINENTITSKSIFKDILWYDPVNNKKPVIGTGIQNFTAKQYETTNIEYTVYDPSTDNPNVTIRVDNDIVSTPTLTQHTNIFSYNSAHVGTHTITISCGDEANETKVITVTIEKLDIDVSPVTVGLAFDFNPIGKSNDDTDRLWKYDDNIAMEVSDNFDWINGGYKIDVNGDPYFCIKSGTTATINYELFGDDAKKTGKEVKVIFKTENVSDPDTTFLSCVEKINELASIGLEMNAHGAKIYGQSSPLELAYSEEDIIEFEFNISSSTEPVPMIMGYEDGVSTRPMVYNDNYNFKQPNPKYITIGSTDCDVHIYRIKAYKTSLTAIDILSNFILDARSTTEMLARYARNQIYDENQQLNPDVLAEKCPWLRVYKLSAPHFTNNKSDKVKNTTIQQIYKNGDPILDNWIAYNAQHSGQGTSSNNYGAAGRNLDFIMNKSGCRIELGNGETADTITLSSTSVPVAYLNAKVNIASSNNLTNALLANRYNRFNPYRRPFVRGDGVNTDYIKDTMEFYNCVIFIQETDPDLTTHREFADTDWHFYAIGNIGDSKKTDNTRATDPNDKYECCVEIMDIGLPLSDFPVGTMIKTPGLIVDDEGKVLIDLSVKDENLILFYEGEFTKTSHTDIQTGTPYYEYNDKTNSYVPVASPKKEHLHALYEATFIQTSDKSVDMNKTYYVDALAVDNFSEGLTYGWRYLGDEEGADSVEYCKQKWIDFYRFVTTSTDEDFKSNLKDYFVVDSALYYYLFTTRYCMVDNRAKNTFWHYGKTADGTHKWDLCWDYDNDTSLGLNNYGKQVYRYGLEDIDVDDSGIEVFRESDSTFFCRIRDCFSTELNIMYQTLESSGLWLAESFLAECDEWQNEFPEELWRLDIQRKYLRTYTESGIDKPGDSKFLVDMCNGRMKYQRRQWERSQELYMASKYKTTKASDSATNAAYFRFTSPTGTLALPVNHNLKITPYSYGYINVDYGRMVSERVKTIGKPVDIECPVGISPDEVKIYNAKMIRDFGDLSSCYPRVVTVGHANKIKKLKLGNSAEVHTNDVTIKYSNNQLTTISLDSNPLLEELDIENITGLKDSLQLNKLINLKTLKAYGTNIQSVSFAPNGRLETAELPALTSLSLRSLKYLSTEGLELSDYSQVVDLTLEDCPELDALALLDKCSNVKRIRFVNVDLGTLDYDYFNDRLFNLTGINSLGEGTDHAWITGKVHINELTGTQYNEIITRYPYLNVTCTKLTCTVTFMITNDISDALIIKVYDKEDCKDPVADNSISTPTKEQTISHYYTYSGWSELQDGVTVIPSPLINVSKDLVLYPTFYEHVRQYTLTFRNNDGSVLNSYKVDYGTNKFEYPGEPPKKAGDKYTDYYKFIGWDPAPENIEGDLDCYAQFEFDGTNMYKFLLGDFNYTTDETKKEMSITKYIGTAVAGEILSVYEDNKVVSLTGFKDSKVDLIILPITLQTIAANAFESCKNLSNINIPSGVSKIESSAFQNCSGLERLTVSKDNTTYKSINNCIVDMSNYTLVVGCNTSVIPIDCNIKTIGASAFYGRIELTNVTIPEGVNMVGQNAFTNCSKLTDIKLPTSLITISGMSFYGCGMSEIDIPDNVETVGMFAFRNCKNLTTVTFKGTPKTIDIKTFGENDNTTIKVINVPWAEGEVANAPWGAKNAIIYYNYGKE